MRPYVIINGVNSNTITGLIINKLPPVSKPQMRVLTEQIDGRDGDINTPLGFSAYDKPLEIGLTAEADVNEVIAYFNQAGEIIFSNEPDKYYKFAIYDAIDFEKLIRFKTATINLHTQPYKYSNTQGALALNSGSNTVVNSGNTVSKPDLILEGSGVVNLSINNRQIIEADLTDVNKILIDSDTMNAYEATLINPIKSIKSDINPVQIGTGTPSPQNVRPISGFSALNVTRTGVNLWESTDNNVLGLVGDNVAYLSGAGTIIITHLISGVTYTISGITGKNRGIIGYFESTPAFNDTAFAYQSFGNPDLTFTATNTGLAYIYIANSILDTTHGQLEIGNQATAYSPYNGQTASVNFGQTVYGGVLDVTRGKLSVTKKIVDLGSLDWTKATSGGVTFFFTDLPNGSLNDGFSGICSKYPLAQGDEWISLDKVFRLYGSTQYNFSRVGIKDSTYVDGDADAFKTAMSGVMLVYELATPIEITTTPENLTAIVGVNNVFSDANGNTEVKVDIDGEEQTLTGEIVTFNIDELDYELGSFANRIVTGNYDNIKLEVGSNNVELTGAFTGGQLTKYSRWL